MKGNVWLAGFIILSLIVIGAAGFFAITNYNTYSRKFGDWDALSSKIGRLEREKPTPTPENEAQFEKELEAYEAKVATLFEALNQFQKPLNLTLQQTELPNIVKTKVDGFRQKAGDDGVDISRIDSSDEPFFMGMDRYRETLPKQEMTPLLAYQLDGIDRILDHMVTAGMKQISELARKDLPGEVAAGSPDANPAEAINPTDVVHKYPMTLSFEGTHSAFRNFLNSLANDKEYFFILRVLAVQNSAPDGPDFTGDPAVIGYLREDGSEVSKAEIEEKIGSKTGPEREEVLNREGWVPKRQDAVILFGEETIKVRAVIDLVRFLAPEETGRDAGDETEGTS